MDGPLLRARSRIDPGPLDPRELAGFVETFIYEPAAFIIDAVLDVDYDQRALRARTETSRHWPIASLQRGPAHVHPRHVSGPELILLTGNLGCLHAYLFHSVRWNQGWVGYGSRIHRADFRELVRLGPPLESCCRETQVRRGRRRIVARYQFEFYQEGRLVFRSDQTAMFLKSLDGQDEAGEAE
ncbi:MAG: hypothetical protein D6815_02115 [Candidatus Dadabacteria bacterium]|nr:MAG: hypothetical protein D6815_02115 [Candidatus Dadabacteria bacterium]